MFVFILQIHLFQKKIKIKIIFSHNLFKDLKANKELFNQEENYFNVICRIFRAEWINDLELGLNSNEHEAHEDEYDNDFGDCDNEN